MSSPFIKIENLNFSYKDSKEILNIKNLEIKKGESLFIYGPSGTGKSTLLNLLAGVLSSKTGAIEINGVDICKLSHSKKDRWRGDHVGYVFQNFNLVPYLTIKENILLPTLFSKIRKNKFSENEVIDLCSKMNLENFLDKKASDLSIGQQQRVAMCRALIGSPDVVIADEPTSALDEKNTEDLMNHLIDIAKSKQTNIIFVSHDLRLKKFFDRDFSLDEINQISL